MTGGGVGEVMTSQGHLVFLRPPPAPPSLRSSTQHLLFSRPLQAASGENDTPSCDEWYLTPRPLAAAANISLSPEPPRPRLAGNAGANGD